jgi:hypothetical protein
MFLQYYVHSGLYTPAIRQACGGLPDKVVFTVEGSVVAAQAEGRRWMESKPVGQVDGLEHGPNFVIPVGPLGQYL